MGRFFWLEDTDFTEEKPGYLACADVVEIDGEVFYSQNAGAIWRGANGRPAGTCHLVKMPEGASLTAGPPVRNEQSALDPHRNLLTNPGDSHLTYKRWTKRTVWVARLLIDKEWSNEVLGVFATEEAAQRKCDEFPYGRRHISAHEIEG